MGGWPAGDVRGNWLQRESSVGGDVWAIAPDEDDGSRLAGNHSQVEGTPPGRGRRGSWSFSLWSSVARDSLTASHHGRLSDNRRLTAKPAITEPWMTNSISPLVPIAGTAYESRCGVSPVRGLTRRIGSAASWLNSVELAPSGVGDPDHPAL